MANVTAGNPWIIDTASDTPLTTTRVRVVNFRWVGGTTAGHTCVVRDRNDCNIWESVAAGANHVDSDSYPIPRLYPGLKVKTLASGRLYISFD